MTPFLLANIPLRVSKSAYATLERQLVTAGYQHRNTATGPLDGTIWVKDHQGKEHAVAEKVGGLCYVYPAVFAR
jgi:hypothetical protein